MNESDWEAEKLSILKKIQEKVEYQTNSLCEEELSEEISKNLLLFDKQLKKIRQTGSALNTIGQYSARLAGNNESMPDFQLAATALAGFNFFRIPLVYLMAYLLGEKVPFTLSNNAKWLYSAVLLALIITSVAVPPLAILIAFVIAGLGLATGVYVLGQVLNERYNLEQKNKSLEQTITSEESVMLAIQDEAKLLEDRLNTATDEQSRIDVDREITLLDGRYQAQKVIINSALNQQIHHQQIMKRLDFKKIDKSISLFLASSTAVGLVLTLFIPPIGFGILAGTALFGATYTLGKVSASLFQLLGEWMASKRELNTKAPPTTLLKENKSSLIPASSPQVIADLTEEKKSSATDTNTNAETPHISPPLFLRPEAKKASDENTDSESEGDELNPH